MILILGRCPEGDRLCMGLPRKATTLVVCFSMTGVVAPAALDGRINGHWFEAYVTWVLVPDPLATDVFIIDNP